MINIQQIPSSFFFCNGLVQVKQYGAALTNDDQDMSS